MTSTLATVATNSHALVRQPAPEPLAAARAAGSPAGSLEGFTEGGCKPFESHGYKQALQLIHGELNARDALFYAQRNTRHYAKRQITWFRRERELQWLKGFGDAPEIRETTLAMVTNFLYPGN